MTLRRLRELGMPKEAYGGERLWGAVSWAITNAALGAVANEHGLTACYVFNAVTASALVALLTMFRYLGNDTT